MFNSYDMIPKYLYHYTSIDTLKKIIDNKTIRFTRLDLLNDPYEGFVSIETKNDVVELPINFMYCSCWSPVEEESVAMWDIYTKRKGVRIKLKYDMFLSPTFQNMTLGEINGIVFPLTKTNTIYCNIDDKQDPVSQVYGPINVIYENDVELNSFAVDKHEIKNGDKSEFLLNDVYLLRKSRSKINHWSYEKEYRYILSPFIEIHGSDEAINPENESINSQMNFKKYIDIRLYQNIEEVILGPDISSKEQVDIEKYLREKGIDNIKKSSVKINKKYY